MKQSSLYTLRALLLLLLCSPSLLSHAQGLPCTFDREDGLCDHLEFSEQDWKSHYFYTSPVITVGHAAETLRFTVTETTSADAGGGYPCFAIAEFYLYDADMNPIALTAADFSTNAQEPLEGPMEYICDDDYATFFHSLWSSFDDSTGEHYIEITLPHSLEAFAFGYVSRYEQVAPASITVSDPVWVEPDPADDDVLSLQAEETSEGEEWVLTISLDSELDYTAFQMDIALSDAITATTTTEVLLADGRASDTHVITSSVLSGGTRRIVCYANDDAPFASQEGDLFYVILTAGGDVPEGSYPLKVSNIRFSTTDGIEKKKEDLTATLTVSAPNAILRPVAVPEATPAWHVSGIRATLPGGLQITPGSKRFTK